MEENLCKKISRLFNTFEKTSYYFGLLPMVDYSPCYTIYSFIVVAIFFILFIILSILEAIYSKTLEDTMFIGVFSIMVINITFRMVEFYRKKNVIKNLLVNTDAFAEVNAYCKENKEKYNAILEKLNTFIDFAYKMYCMFIVTVLMMIIVPLFSKEKILLLRIWVPFEADWRTNDIVFWILYVFTNSTMVLCTISIGRCLFVWYIMLNISIKFEVLECRFENLKSQQSSTRKDFIDCIQYHLQIKA